MQKKDWTSQAEILKTLGHPVRLCIVAGLAEGSCNVGTMQECLGVPQSTVSQHLAALKAKGIVRGVRKGTQVCYEISDDRIITLVKMMTEMEKWSGQEGWGMISVTPAAMSKLDEQLKNHQKQKEDVAFRVYFAGAGWGGPRLGLALEEPQEEDNIYDFDGYKFAIDSEFEAAIGSAEVDYASGWLNKGLFVKAKFGSSCS